MMMNFLDLSAASEEERRLIREILSDTSVVNIAEPPPSSQPFKSNSQNHHHHHQQHINFSSNSNNCQHTISNNNNNPTSDGLTAPQNHHRNNNYNNINNSSAGTSGNSSSSGGNTNNDNSSSSQQRKNIHSSNNVNSINNISGSHRNNGLKNSSNVASGVNNIHHQHYPIQYAPQLPSSDPSSTPHFHNMNVNNSNTSNINNHNASNSSLNSQLNQHQQQQQQQQHNQRTNNGQINERLRTGLNNNNISHSSSTSTSNHINNTNNSTNIAVTSNSGLIPIAPNLDQHHVNTMPLNFYNHHTTSQMHHQVPTRMQTAKSDHKSGSLKNSQQYHSEVTSTSIQNTTIGAPSVPPSAQMPAIAGDINTVIGMDMASTQPTGYAMQPHVTAFGPPHQIYGGPPMFQPNYYLIPYPTSAYMPYNILPPNSVVPPRQQVPLQSNQHPNANASPSTHPRSHSQHMSQQQQNPETFTTSNSQVNQQQSSKDDNVLKKDVIPSHQSQNMKKNCSERELSDIQRNSSVIKTPFKPVNAQNDNRLMLQKSDKTKKIPQGPDLQFGSDPKISEGPLNTREYDVANNEKTTKLVPNFKPSNISRANPLNMPKNKNVPNIKNDVQVQKVDPEDISAQNNLSKLHGSNRDIQDHSRDTIKYQDARFPTANHKTSGEDTVKVSSDEGFDTQSSLDLSKRSQESTTTSADNSKSSPENCNKSTPERVSQDSSRSNDVKANEAPSRTGGPWASSKSWADLFKRGGDAIAGLPLNGEVEHNSGSENSDDDNRNHRLVSSMKVDTINRVSGLGRSSKEQRSQEIAKRALDKMAPVLAQKIGSITLKHALPFLKPRGFINKGNGCYINATLQALIACPPFYNLMKEIGDLKVTRRDNSCTPILDSFAEFFLNFPPLDSSKKNKQSSASLDQKTHISTIQAEAIEPKCIYNVLGQIKSECLRGAQEDAEEFLSSVLNGLHEEMIGLGEVIQSMQDSSARSNHQSDAEDLNDDIANDDNLWREVGPKNRSLPIRTAKVINTPIQEIFGGSLFSIRTAGKDRCGHRSPFFDLQLDISGDNVKSVQDAIKSFTATEIIHDFYCSKLKQKTDAQRRTSLDQLPPILILHLKQFVYTHDQGLKKLIKKIEYPIDLELPENCLHEKNSADRNLLTSRSYKLLAVVYHDGKEAIKGHYLTDVYHIGSSQWIRCDDSNLKVIPSPRIENPDSSRTPYLLFYRRLNTLRAQTGNHDNKKKN